MVADSKRTDYFALRRKDAEGEFSRRGALITQMVAAVRGKGDDNIEIAENIRILFPTHLLDFIQIQRI